MDIVKAIGHGLLPAFANTFVLGIVVFVGAMVFKRYKDTENDTFQTRTKALSVLSSLGFKDLMQTFNEYEQLIASQLVDPSEIDVSFKDIAGIDDIIDLIKSSVILPFLAYPSMREKSQYFQPPKGVLLYGPPGCGKTMIAKATAKEARANFLNLEVPSLLNKWYGESQKLATAVFTLAEKIQPCIIFIDEIDTFLRSREANDHESTAMMKAQFMILWDGLYSRKSEGGILVLGATNRPSDVDEAIRRRLPSKFEVPLPTLEQRRTILNHLLINEPLDSDVNVENLSNVTNEFSSSDLKELCRIAVFNRVREGSPNLIQFFSEKKDTNSDDGMSKFLSKLRKVNCSDFEFALKQMESNKIKTKEHSHHSHHHPH